MTNDNRNDSNDARNGGSEPGSELDRELERLFERVSIEPAPASLRRRLRRIPLEEQPRAGWWRRLFPAALEPRFVLVPALAAALLAVGVVLLMPRQPSEAEVLEARAELAVAFRYIGKVGRETGHEIRSVLDGELRQPVKESLSEHIPFTEQFRKEESS